MILGHAVHALPIGAGAPDAVSLDAVTLRAAGLLGAVLQAATPEPADVVPQTPPDELVTPGTAGFLAIFVVAVALVFLVRDMNRRVRTVRVRAERADDRLRRQDSSVAPGVAGTGEEVPDTRTADPLTRGDGLDEDRDPPAALNG